MRYDSNAKGAQKGLLNRLIVAIILVMTKDMLLAETKRMFHFAAAQQVFAER